MARQGDYTSLESHDCADVKDLTSATIIWVHSKPRVSSL